MPLRSLPLLALVFGAWANASSVCAQPWLEGREWNGPRAREVRCTGPGGVLPAGVFWTEVGWYEQQLDCPRPVAAVVFGVHRDESSARAALRRARPLSRTPGYPWVTHTHAAGLEGDGIAIVMGLFATREAAETFRADRSELAIVGVLSDEDAIARFPVGAGGEAPAEIPIVTHVLAAESVPAYAIEQVRAVERSSSDEEQSPSETRGSRTERLAAARVACRVEPDAIFFFARAPGNNLRTWHPVRCGRDRVAWIELANTATTAVTWSDRDGRAFITQVSLVECDVPTHTTWELLATLARRDPRIRRRSCG
jgi:hypothetical protein